MRVGNNPNRDKGANAYMPVILTCVTHLPNQEGYHAKRFDVIRTCLETMRDNADMETTVIIWDNGSCQEFRNWLQLEYKPDIAILSENMGKTLGRASMYRMLPPSSIISYCDDDIYFYPNWLKPQIELLKTFPNVAAVSGYPIRTQFRWGVKNTVKWAKNKAELETGRFISEQHEKDFCVSIGRDWDYHKDYTKDDLDYRVTYEGKQAYCTAHHCQLIGYQKNLVKAVHFDGRAMGDERPFDTSLDELGLRLCTTERLTRHMGNVMEASYA